MSKNFAAITSGRHKPVLERILPAGCHYYVDENPNVRGKLAEWEKLNVDVVVVDDDGLPYKDVNEHDLYTYPATAARKMQIIFIPSAERGDEDPFLRKLVRVGIYDIVDPRLSGPEAKEAIERMIAKPSVLADAIKYFGEDDAEPSKKRKPRKPKQDSGMLRKFLGQKREEAEEEEAVQSDPLSNLEEATTRRCSCCDSEYPRNADACPVCGRSADVPGDAPDPTGHGHTPDVAAESAVRLEPIRGLAKEHVAPDPAFIEKARVSALERLKSATDASAAPDAGMPDGVGGTAPLAPLPSEASDAPEPVAERSGGKSEGSDAEPEGAGTAVLDEELIEALADAVLAIVDERMREREGETSGRTEADMAGKEANGGKKRMTVAVSELMDGAGSTSLALALAFYLAKRWPNSTVACAMTDRAKLNALLPERSEGFLGLVHKDVTIGMLGAERLDEADWLVIDCGQMNHAVESRARSAFQTAALKCMCVPSEPWNASRTMDLASKLPYQDRITWTWCFGAPTQQFARALLDVVADGKGRRPYSFAVPEDPDYFFGESRGDYYPLIRHLVGKGRRERNDSNKARKAEKRDRRVHEDAGEASADDAGPDTGRLENQGGEDATGCDADAAEAER